VEDEGGVGSLNLPGGHN